MKKLTLMTLTLLGAFCMASAFADETVKIFPAGGANDVIKPTEKDPVGDAGGAIVKKSDCILNTGQVIKAEDPNYGKCMEMKGGGKPKTLEKKAKKGEQ